MTINYNHDDNPHTLEGPSLALPIILNQKQASSLLDVGCGIGVWLKAAANIGLTDITGVEGQPLDTSKMLIAPRHIVFHDLTRPLDLKRKFDLVLCLEVGEHLDAMYSRVLIDTLTHHGDYIVFSAACPDQVGQGHVNCNFPRYWQSLFNEKGFACDDYIRWAIWGCEAIEPWYKNNIFTAQRNEVLAGSEARIKDVIHPQMIGYLAAMDELLRRNVLKIENGEMRLDWYLRCIPNALLRKVFRRIRRYKYVK